MTGGFSGLQGQVNTHIILCGPNAKPIADPLAPPVINPRDAVALIKSRLSVGTSGKLLRKAEPRRLQIAQGKVSQLEITSDEPRVGLAFVRLTPWRKKVS